MKLAANISLLYPGLTLTQRVEAAIRDGFSAVEILFPYGGSYDELKAVLQTNDVELALINTPLGPNGEKGLASVPGREHDFEAGFHQALTVCRETGCKTIHVMAGRLTSSANSPAHATTLLENLRRVTPLAASAGVTLTLEALNRQDVPDYFYFQPKQVISIIEAVNSPNVRLQFDFYHTEVEHLDLPNTLEESLPWIHHVQFAHPNGRHEPDIDAPPVYAALRTLAQSGYSGWVGCEYTPRSSVQEGLIWRKAYWELVDGAWQG